MPVAILDREHQGALNQLGVVTRKCLKCYIFHQSFPESIRHTILNNNLIVMGDGRSFISQLGSVPTHFLHLSTYTLDIPTVDKNNNMTHKMGVEGCALLLFNMKLKNIKDVGATMAGHSQLARDCCENGHFIGEGFTHTTSYPYASLDIFVDGLNFLFVLGLRSTFLLKQHWKLSKENRMEILFSSLKKGYLIGMMIKPINLRQEVFHEGVKHFRDNGQVKLRVYVPPVKLTYTVQATASTYSN